MDAILFASFVTAIFGYPYYKLTHRQPVIDYISDKSDDHEPTNHEIRQSPEYRAWRIAVLKRDGFKCIYCDETQNLEAHHIYSFSSFPELRFDTMNGLTVCRYHHTLTPNYGGKEKAFSQQIINS